MFEHLDMAIGFVVVMLAVSLLITVCVQSASAVLGLRGTNLRWGIEELVRTLYPGLETHAGAMADRILKHPLISDSTLSRFTGVLSIPIVGRWMRRLHYAKAIRLQELVGIMEAVAPAIAQPSTGVVASVSGGPMPGLAVPSDKLQFWFDSTMDRVSQRFSVQIRVWTVAFSIAVAFALHLDAFRLIAQLSSAPETRAKLAAAADSLERSAQGLRSTDDRGPAGDDAVRRLTDEAGSIRATLGNAGVQLIPDPYHSWDMSPWWPAVVWAGPRPATLVNFFYSLFFVRPSNLHFWGILFSAGLLSLGAPFWFNALKSLSALKPVVAKKENEERTAVSR